MARFSLSDWNVEQIRLTVFPVPNSSAPPLDWWKNVTGNEPDETTVNAKKGLAVIQGAFGPGKLILRCEPGRVDWLLARDADEIAATNEFPILGRLMEVVESFSTIVEGWLHRNDLPGVARIAYGPILVHPEPDRTAGYLHLPDYVPVSVDPASSDFLYQINLPPIPSRTGIEGLTLNRLSKWSVAVWKSVTLQLGRTATLAQNVPDFAALRLELDINTVPAFQGPIPQERVIDLYREFVEIGHGIAANGVRL